MKTLGIIGYGHFGQFLAGKLEPYFKLSIYSASGKQSPWSASLKEAASCDYLILSIPLSKHKEVCEQLRPHLGPKTVIVDVCSIKGESGIIIQRTLPKQPMLSTHPLFGPESASDSLDGHVVVLCPDKSTDSELQACSAFCRQLGLKVVTMSADEHDKHLALIQGLTFFVARVLKDFNLHESPLETGSFKKLVALANLEKQHTKDLFITIQKGNPYTEEVRQHFIDRAQELQDLLAKETIPE